MKYIIGLVTLGLALSSFGAGDKAKVTAAASAYKAAGKELMGLINTGKVDASAAEKLVTTMGNQAKIICEEYVKQDASSKKLFDFVLSKYSDITKANFETLEKGWHDGEIIKKEIAVDLKDESNEKFTDPLHTLVHPFLTFQAIKSKDLKAAKEELAEGLEQVETTVKSFK